MFVRPASTSTRERPLAMSSASATRTIAASIVSGLPRERWRDHRVHRLGDDDRALRLVVDALQQLRQLVRAEEQRVRLVVGAVHGHPDAVQERRRRDDDLGVALLHPVILDDARRHAGAEQEPCQAQRDVEHDLDVDPRVVVHVQAAPR